MSVRPAGPPSASTSAREELRGPFWRDGPWKDRDDLGTATAQWVNWYNRTRPHRANPDDLSPAAAEHRYHRNHTITTAAPPATA